MAALRRDHAGILQVQIGLIELGLRLLQRTLGALELGLQRLDAELGPGERRLGAHHVGLLRLQVGAGLLLALHGPCPLLDQVAGTGLLLLSEVELGLGLVDLRLGLRDLLLLALDLGLDIVDIGLPDRHLCLGLVDGDLVVALIDAGEEVAGIDVLVIGHGHVGDIATDLGRDREAACCDEGVVRAFVMADVEPIREAADRRRDQDTDDDGRQNRVLPQAVTEGRLVLRRIVALLGRRVALALLVRPVLRRLRFFRERLPRLGLGIHVDLPRLVVNAPPHLLQMLQG